MQGFCVNCNEWREVNITERKEIYQVKNEDITIDDAVITICKECGEEIIIPDIESENLEKAYNLYRKNKGVVSPEEIKNFRKKHGLSQRSLAEKLGWSPATINRYEQGAIPEPAHNEVLKRLLTGEGVREITQNPDLNISSAEMVIEREIEYSPGIESGYATLNLEKLYNMIIFFTKDKPLSKTALMKHLWFADVLNYQETTKAISGARYAALPNGPALNEWRAFLDFGEEEGYIDIDLVFNGDYEAEYIKAKKDFDPSLFDKYELKNMNYVKEKLNGQSAQALSDLFHKIRAWKDTPGSKIISFKYFEEEPISL